VSPYYAAANALLASGVTDAIAAIQVAAEAGSYEEAVDWLIYAAKEIIQSKPLVRAFLCSPVVIVYDFGVDELNLYAQSHNWSPLMVKSMDWTLDKGKDALKTACGAYILGIIK